jgi:hypothetical protein
MSLQGDRDGRGGKRRGRRSIFDDIEEEAPRRM